MNSNDKKEFKRLQKGKLKAQANGKLKEEAEICNVLGELLSRYGEYEEAIKEHRQELRLSESLEDVIGAAVARRKIGECCGQLGLYEEALRHQRQHLALARSVASAVEEQRARATIGRTLLCQAESQRQGDPDSALSTLHKARESFLKSLEVCGRLRGEVSERELVEMKARLYLNIGLVYDYQGEHANSAKFIKQAVFIAEKHNLLEDLYRSHCSQGDIHQRTGDSTKAMRSFENAMKAARRLKDKNLESDALSSSATVMIQLGDFAAAKRALRKAYKLGSQKPEERETVIRTLKAAIRGSQLQGEVEEASDVAYRERLPLYEALGDLCCKVNAFTRAAIYYQRQLSCALALKGSPKELVRIYVSLAATYADDSQYDKAIEMYHKELELRKGHPKEEGRTWLNIADAQERSRKPFETISQSYKSALEYAQKAQHPKLQLLALRSLSLLQRKHRQELLLGNTMGKIHHLKDQHDIASDEEDEISEEEDQEEGEGDQEESEAWEVDALELSESEESEVEEEYDRTPAAQRARKTKFAKRNEKGETLLHRACIDGNLRQVKKLLQQGHPVNPRDYCGWIPLHEACNFGHLGIAEALLDHGAEVNDRGGEGCSGITPLHDAINGGNFAVAELLVGRGANVCAKDDKGMNAMMTLTQWTETYTSDLDQETRQGANNMKATLQQAIRHGGQQPSQSRPRNVLENSELFDRDDGASQPSSSGHLAGPSNSGRRTGAGGRSASAGGGRRQPTDSSSGAQRRSALLRRNRARGERGGESDEGEGVDEGACYPEPSRVDSDEEEEEEMEVSRDAMPVMTSHTRARVSAGGPSMSTKTAADDREAIDGVPSKSQGDRASARNQIDEDSDGGDGDDSRQPASAAGSSGGAGDGRQAYISAITGLGSAASRLSQRPLREALPPAAAAAPALIPEAQYTGGDDWLIDDLPTQPSKRKRMDPDFEAAAVSPSAPASSPGPGRSHQPAASQQRPLSLSRKSSKRSRQLKLTTMGAALSSRQARRAAPSSPLVEEADTRPDSDSDFNPSQPVRSEMSDALPIDLISEHTPRREGGPTSDLQPQAAGAAMRVRVRIRDKTFLIPVRDAKDMQWLCEEASRRYFSACGLRPTLVLCTNEGAMFSPEDSIADLLNNNEEVIGKVESWDLPPLAERYRRACETAKAGENPKIRSHLQLAQSAPHSLDLSGLALPAAQLAPFLLALQCQYSLRKLLLPGNRLAEAALGPLVAALASLPNLSVLDLSGNGLGPEGLKRLQDGVTEGGAGGGSGGSTGHAGRGQGDAKPLQLLEELNLGYNPLTDASAPYLAALVGHCHLLADLSLTSCDLTAKLFQLHRRSLSQAFQGASNLRMLRISHNALGSTGAELFLRCLPPDVVTGLDLSCVIPSALGSNLVKHLVGYLTEPDCMLKELYLSGCHLSDDDILDLSRCLSSRSCLTSLDLSANCRLTEASICPLLQALAGAGAATESLDLSGCGLRSPLSTDFLALLALRLAGGGQARAPLKRLRLCSNGLGRRDCQMVLGVWEDGHGQAAMHHVDAVRCLLYVRE